MSRKRTKLICDDEAYEEGDTQAVTTTTRRRRGYLKMAMNLPLELLHEIFSHLSPLDLLHIARTSKHFRSFILSRSAIGVWRDARASIEGLPDCPAFLSEPAYAHLMFSSYCQQCLTGHIQNAILSFMVRYCNNCKKAQTVESYLLGGRGGYAGGLTEDMFCKTFGERRKVIYHKPEVERIWEEWLALPNDENVREEYRQKQRSRVEGITKHAALCFKFVDTRRQSRTQEIKELKKHKVDAVIERLSALGWQAELDEMKGDGYRELADHSSVRQIRKVTDKTWSEVEKTLVDFMTTCRKHRLTKKRRGEITQRLQWFNAVLREHYSDLRTTNSDFLPTFSDFAVMPEVQELAAAPSSRTITREDFVVLKAKIPQMEDRWSLQVHQQVNQVVTNGYINYDGLGLLLALTFFDCTSCGRRAMQFPAVLAHRCLRSRYYRGIDVYDSAYLYQDVAFAIGGSRPWMCQNLVISPATERARKIIIACGEDPREVLQQDMIKRKHRVCCKSCSREEVKLVMGWQSAVEHARVAHSAIDQEEAEWEEVSEVTAEKARQVEIDNIETNFESYVSQIEWACARCMISPFPHGKMTLSLALEHARSAHHIHNPSSGSGDIYIAGDSQPLLPKPVLLVSDTLKRSDLTPKEDAYWKTGGGVFWDFCTPPNPDSN